MSTYYIIYGVACKDVIPKSVSLPEGHHYRSINTLSHEEPGYYGILVGTVSNIYERVIISGTRMNFGIKFAGDYEKKFSKFLPREPRKMTETRCEYLEQMFKHNETVIIPDNIRQFVYEDDTPRLHVVFEGKCNSHSAQGCVLFGSLVDMSHIENYDDFIIESDRVKMMFKREFEANVECCNFQSAHAHPYFNKKFAFYGENSGKLPALQFHLSGNYLHASHKNLHEMKKLLEIEHEIIDMLLAILISEHYLWAVDTYPCSNLIDQYFEKNPDKGTVIVQNVFMFVPVSCHCCT
jgi:hypothetical protein